MDHVGCWCAFCLDYIASEDEFELHHVIGQEYTKRVFQEGPFRRSWVVPVHSNRSEERRLCHHQLDFLSANLGANLEEAQTRLASGSKSVEEFCLASWERGHLGMAVMLRALLTQHFVALKDFNSAKEHQTYMFNAQAGLSCCPEILKWEQSYFQVHRRALRAWAQDPLFMLNFGTVLYSANLRGQAHEVCDHIERTLPRWRPTSKHVYGVCRRRISLITNEVNDARSALIVSRDLKEYYGLRTAHAFLGNAFLKAGNASQALQSFYGMQTDVHDSNQSFWHLHEYYLGLGCSFYLDGGDVRRAIGFLLQAQYLAAMLGLAGMLEKIVPELLLGKSAEYPKGMGAADVIRFLGDKACIDGDEMLELRKVAIAGSGLQTQVFNLLKRWAWN